MVRLCDGILDFFAPHDRKAVFPESIRNILVIRLDQIGDVVCALPVFPILKRRFPSARVTALVSGEGKAVLEHNPFVDRIVVFGSNWFSRSGSVDLEELFRLTADLRETRFELGFDLRGDLRTIAFMTASRVRYRIGYGIAGGAALLHRMPDYDMSRHQVELNRNLVTDEPIDKRNLKPEIYLTLEETKEAWKRLDSFGVDRGSDLIAIHPEAGYPSKEWGDEKFIQLIEKLIRDAELKILVFGLNHARRVAEHFASSDRVVNLVSLLSLRQMIAVLHCCRLFVGNDSGPSHLAHALGLACVVIASGTNEYERWGIWREPVTIRKHEVPCSPCHLPVCNVAGHPCMSEISVDDVLATIQSVAPC
ncbi:MAG: hypothetical protein A3G87_00985 [Omnitrophica bacterium RIFCSPLOWO2_12_FULL_50_11]|nr:MAG: hypothetical protein A3G87_00985 [Omnitrophica bacterium RIFCSPLOWO2_12_FULL_50_11]